MSWVEITGRGYLNFGDNTVMGDTYINGFQNLNPNYQTGYYRVYIVPMKR